MDAVGNVSHDIGPDITELINENINVIGDSFGSLVPSRKKLMMGEGARNRIGEVGTLECSETFETTRGVFAGFGILKAQLEKS